MAETWDPLRWRANAEQTCDTKLYVCCKSLKLRNEWTTAGEADKVEQIWGDVLTNGTKHKETIVHKLFRQK